MGTAAKTARYDVASRRWKTAAKKTAAKTAAKTAKKAAKMKMVRLIGQLRDSARLRLVSPSVHGGRECIEVTNPLYDVEVYAWDGKFYEDDVGTLGAPTSRFCPVYVAYYAAGFDHGKFYNTLADWLYGNLPCRVVRASVRRSASQRTSWAVRRG